jgi:hypothetical protein
MFMPMPAVSIIRLIEADAAVHRLSLFRKKALQAEFQVSTSAQMHSGRTSFSLASTTPSLHGISQTCSLQLQVAPASQASHAASRHGKAGGQFPLLHGSVQALQALQARQALRAFQAAMEATSQATSSLSDLQQAAIQVADPASSSVALNLLQADLADGAQEAAAVVLPAEAVAALLPVALWAGVLAEVAAVRVEEEAATNGGSRHQRGLPTLPVDSPTGSGCGHSRAGCASQAWTGLREAPQRL